MSRFVRQLRLRFRSLFWRGTVERELNEELEYHLDRQIEEGLARGLTPEGARYAALRELGPIVQSQEECRDMRRVSRIDSIVQDLRFSVRGLWNSRAFSIVAVLTLALGIGSSASIFSVVDAVLLRPLPYPDPHEIVRLWEVGERGQRMNLADLNFDDFRRQNNTFTGMAAYGHKLASVSGGSEPLRANVAWVSSDFFHVLGVQPFRGRGFSAEEQRLHGAPAAIISYGYWQRYLGGAADFSSFKLRLDGVAHPIVGVMPEGFDFPRGVAVWTPQERYPAVGSRSAHNWCGLGRLRNGVTVEQARADLGAIAHRIREQYPKDVHLVDAAVVPLPDAMVGDVRTGLLTLLGAVGLLLLVASANVAGLLVARTSARRKELAVRAALGAGRGRLIQQFLVESFVLSLIGAVLGLVVASWAVNILPAIFPANLPRQEGIALNNAVLGFAFGVTVAIALSLGLIAAWRAGSGDLQEALGAGSRAYTASTASQKLRSVLVTGEIATALVVLVGAGLLSRSFVRLISTNPGFNQQNLITMEFSPPAPDWKVDEMAIVRQGQLFDGMLTRLRAVPGAKNVGLIGGIPVAAGDNFPEGDFLILNGQKSPTNFEEWGRIGQNPANVGHALYAVADEDYFRTMGIPAIRGRLFGRQDDWASPHVALISQTLARQRWPDQDPVGRMIHFGNMDGGLKPLTIVGIVGDVRARGLDHPPSSVVYVNYRQRGMKNNSSPTIVVRSSASLGEIAPVARGIFRDLAPDVPVKFSTFAEEMGGWLADRRFLLLLVGLFAVMALGLAAIGIYGVVAFSVARRTQEIGIRMAIGARRTDVPRLVLGEGARMAAAGVAIGIAVSLAITRLLESLLFDVSATDPMTLLGVALVLCLVALIASYIPAHRAVRLDPMTALRHE